MEEKKASSEPTWDGLVAFLGGSIACCFFFKVMRPHDLSRFLWSATPPSLALGVVAWGSLYLFLFMYQSQRDIDPPPHSTLHHGGGGNWCVCDGGLPQCLSTTSWKGSPHDVGDSLSISRRPVPVLGAWFGSH